jgi:hypothetical protein
VEAWCSVECIYHVDDACSWRCGAEGSRCRMWLDGLAQGGGTVRRGGGIDGEPGERLELGSQTER